MLKSASLMQKVRKIINLRFAELNQPGNFLSGDGAKLSSWLNRQINGVNGIFQRSRKHPSVQVLVIGLALVGIISLGQYLLPTPNTLVKVTPSESNHQETVLPTLLKEPTGSPEGSPSAPAEMPLEIYSVPTTASVPEETSQTASFSPDWTGSRKPIRGQIITAFGFGYAEFFDDYRLHGGIDFTAPKGSPVLAVLGGTIQAIEEHELFGPRITIEHGDGWQSVYAPVENIAVIPGQWVAGGDPLGTLGSPPLVEGNGGTHLHFELHQHGEPVDPAPYLK